LVFQPLFLVFLPDAVDLIEALCEGTSLADAEKFARSRMASACRGRLGAEFPEDKLGEFLPCRRYGIAAFVIGGEHRVGRDEVPILDDGGDSVHWSRMEKADILFPHLHGLARFKLQEEPAFGAGGDARQLCLEKDE